MFDWNDEELTNIIWDEAGESDDHIVPYPEVREDYGKKKEWNQEAINRKLNEYKLHDIHGRKLESSPKSNEGASALGFRIDSWPNLSLSTAAKTDQDSLDTSVSNNLTEITKLDSSGGAETVQLDKDAEIFQKGKEQGDFVDYGWANIGSFDDLDRIFSNDDPIFGSVSLSNADELWSSSKDVTNSPEKPFPIFSDSPTLGLGPLRNTSEHFEVKSEYEQENDQPFTIDYGKVNDPAYHGLQNASAVLDHVEYAGVKSKPIVKEQSNLSIMGKKAMANSPLSVNNVAVPHELADKVHKQKKHLKIRKRSEEQTGIQLYQNLYGNWSSAGDLPGQFKSQFSPAIASPSVLSQPRPLRGHETLQYQQISNPLVAPSVYGTLTSPCPAMPVLSHIQSGEFRSQAVLSGYEVSSGNTNSMNKLADYLAKPQAMTPQEKIEKLRRRQQIQAMLAIQKQQQQFGNQVSCSDQSISQKCSQEKIQVVEGANLEVEDLSNVPAFDSYSPAEQADSSTISLAVNDCSAEDAVLYRLQDIIAKLDVRIRLCMRDSLFRLARSAAQRHYASDTSSTNNRSRDEQVVTKEETSGQNRSAKMSEAETETNPIDRTVAHLLFHRPLELSGKHPDAPESPASTKLPIEQKALGIAKLSTGCLPETLKSKRIFSSQRSKTSGPLADSQPSTQCKNSAFVDTPDNPLDTDDVCKDVEPSQ